MLSLPTLFLSVIERFHEQRGRRHQTLAERAWNPGS